MSVPDRTADRSTTNGGTIPECLAPRAHPSRPGWTAPSLATDCHFHINGPFARYPLSSDRIYSPPEALIADYRRVTSALGIERMVIVQPSTFGTDNRCTLDAVELLGRGRTRAVVVVDADIDEQTIADMAAAGARGVRFNVIHSNAPAPARLSRLADKLAAFGWHIQFYGDAEGLVELEPVLSSLSVPLVLDHMAGVQAARGIDSAGFKVAERLLVSGKAYVKLCAYRSSKRGYPYEDVAPIARRFIAAAPDRCLWGTDWPHPSLFGDAEMPDDGKLFDVLGEWASTDGLRRKILVDNPARLYGFD